MKKKVGVEKRGKYTKNEQILPHGVFAEYSGEQADPPPRAGVLRETLRRGSETILVYDGRLIISKGSCKKFFFI